MLNVQSYDDRGFQNLPTWAVELMDIKWARGKDSHVNKWVESERGSWRNAMCYSIEWGSVYHFEAIVIALRIGFGSSYTLLKYNLDRRDMEAIYTARKS